MICWPTIAMGNFVLTVSRNWSLSIIRYNNVAGARAMPRASCREKINAHRRANRAHLRLRQNALDNLTIIRMVVLRGRFESGRDVCRAWGNGNWDWDYA